jgi:hypothetical protein
MSEMIMVQERDAMDVDKARGIAKAVAHRQDGTSQALYVMDQEIARHETNATAVAVWMDAIDGILGCEFERAEPSASGKQGYKCRICDHYSNAPVRGSVQPCRQKVAAARGVVRPSQK